MKYIKLYEEIDFDFDWENEPETIGDKFKAGDIVRCIKSYEHPVFRFASEFDVGEELKIERIRKDKTGVYTDAYTSNRTRKNHPHQKVTVYFFRGKIELPHSGWKFFVEDDEKMDDYFQKVITESIDFDDWDYEDEEPFDKEEFILYELYEHVGKDIHKFINWLNDNISGKKIHVYEYKKEEKIYKSWRKISVKEFKVPSLVPEYNNYDYPRIEFCKVVNSGDNISLIGDDRITVIGNIKESIDFDENDWEYEEEEPKPKVPQNWCIKVTEKNKRVLQSIKWGNWDINYNYTIGGYYSPSSGSYTKDGRKEIKFDLFLKIVK